VGLSWSADNSRQHTCYDTVIPLNYCISLPLLAGMLFSPLIVCLLVCLFVRKTTKNLWADFYEIRGEGRMWKQNNPERIFSISWILQA